MGRSVWWSVCREITSARRKRTRHFLRRLNSLRRFKDIVTKQKLSDWRLDPHREWNRGFMAGFRRSHRRYEDSKRALPKIATHASIGSLRFWKRLN